MLGRNVNDIEEAVSTITSSLLQRARASDQVSWKLLVDLHAPLVYRWCRRRGLGAEEARDVSQEVFAAVVRQLNRFHRERVRASFRGWLRTITENKIRDFWREANRHPVAHLAGEYFPDACPSESLVEDSPASENAAILVKILEYARNQISPEHWTVFWKLVAEEKSPADVAAETGIERANVYMIKSRVLRQLRDLWSPPEKKDRRT